MAGAAMAPAPRASAPELQAMVRFFHLPGAEQKAAMRELSVPERRGLLERWRLWAHDGQFAPPGDWRVWMIRAGRGFGKTRAGAEWLSAEMRRRPDGRFALVGATLDEVRRVMVEGEGGLIAVRQAGEGIAWRPGAGELTFSNGARAYAYSAAAAEALRGPEHHAAWCDELAKWRDGGTAWDNLMLGLRLGERPRALVTTTPRPTALMTRLLAGPGLVETRGTTRDNLHLPASFVAAVEALYAGTRLGRQEIEGELLDEADGALWTRATLRACRGAPPPGGWERVVVAVDPPAGIGRDACGIVAAGLTEGIVWVLEDASVAGASPERWALAAAACAGRHGAGQVVAEANQGGEMVREVLRHAAGALPVTLVHARAAKAVRAEPVAALYERGRVRHAGTFAALEEELAGMAIGGGYEGPGRSPDRADALVWAVRALLVDAKGEAGVRVV
jgi:phage terminase large subunit-like protein